MEVIIRPNAEQAAGLTAQLIAQRVQNKPDLVLGLATGRTMEQVYGELVKLYQANAISFAACHSFNLDEYIGLAPDDPQSYRYYMNEHLFRHIDIALENTHVLNGMAEDQVAEAAAYEAKIIQLGGIDVQLLGIGEAGHIGFNEPLSALMSRTRDKTLTPVTRQQNAGIFGGDVSKVPKRALTMGVGTVLDAAELILLVTGEAKANILAQAVEGPITAMVSASAIQLHRNCKVIIDEAAASQLQGRDYYDWVFANEPEWAPYRN